MSATTVYCVWDDSEDSMGCACCKTTANERLLAMYFDLENAKEKLKDLAKQDAEAGYSIEWDVDELWVEAHEGDHTVHKFFVAADEVK